MRVKSSIIFLLIILVVGVLAYTSIYGVELGNFKLSKIEDELDLGLDLAGGVFVVLEAQTDAGGDELRRMMQQTKAIITQRVDGLGVAEPSIVIEGDRRIRVELAGIDNPQEALETIGKTAQLQFIDPDGEVIVTGEHIVKSDPGYDEYNRPVVNLEFNREGTEKFKEATTRLSPNREILAIVLDGEPISLPQVNDPIPSGRSYISGSATIEEAAKLANLIRAGALPVEMEALRTSVTGPTLGLEALNKSVYAAGIGLLLIFLFMIIFYRIPGVIASIGLTIYILIVLGVMAAIDAKLTLAGIAGLILSIGMAVDANVVIFERIKEEIRNGKTLRASVDSGFKKALTTVLDANITTFIAGIVLYNFGTGPIKGFGVTLMIGLAASMLTAVFITKYMLRLTISMNITKNTKLYGA